MKQMLATMLLLGFGAAATADWLGPEAKDSDRYTPRSLEKILAAVVLKPGERLSASAIADWCRERLAPHKVPRYVAFVDTLPHTPTHKIAKAQMRQDAALLAGATDLAAGR